MEEYKLVGLSSDYEGREFTFESRLTIGRAEDNGLVVKQSGMSRHHAEITVAGSKVIIKDLGSANGTIVNGDQVITRELISGDKVRVGEAEFIFVTPTPFVAPVPVTPDEPTDAGATAFIDMSSAMALDKKEYEEKTSRPPATEYVDMRKIVAPKDDAPPEEPVDTEDVFSTVPPPPDSGSTSFIDMSEMMQEIDAQKSAPKPPVVEEKPASPDDAKMPADTRKSPFVLCFSINKVEQKFELPFGSVKVGRDKKCDIVIPESSISPTHAKFTFDGSSLQVEDAGTASGVFVNLEKVITSRIVRPGDEILLGRFALYVRRAVSDESRVIRIDISPKKKHRFLAWLRRFFGYDE